MKIMVTSLIALLVFIASGYCQIITYNQEIMLTSVTGFWDVVPAVIGLHEGGFVACWEAFSSDPSESGIYGQVFDDQGIKKGNVFQAISNTHNAELGSSISALFDGRFVICWANFGKETIGYGIWGQVFNSDGIKRGDIFQIDSDSTNTQRDLSVAGLADGGFVVCWSRYGGDGSGWGISSQLFDGNNVKQGSEFQVNTTTKNDQVRPSVVGLVDGNFVVCWASYRESGAEGSDVYCQIFDAKRQKKGNEHLVSASSRAGIAALVDGGFLAYWGSYEKGFEGQIFDQVGVKRGAEIHITDRFESMAIAGLSNGGFAVGMVHNSDIYYQLYDANASKLGLEFRVNDDVNYSQCYPSFVRSLSGGFFIFWAHKGPDRLRTDIYGKYYLEEPIHHPLHNYTLLEPANDATLNSSLVTFRWQQSSATRECYPWELIFDLYYDNDSSFTNPNIVKNFQDTTYTIDSLAAGKTYFWKVLAKNLAGDSLWSTQQDWGFFIKPGATLVENADNEMPLNFELFQNYPNPFNSSTEIRYILPSGKTSYHIQLKVYDVLGRLVKVLVDQEQFAGSYAISWDGADLGGNHVASGVYFYTFVAGDLKSIRKMLVLQ